MPRSEKLAFLALTLHACGFQVGYELMRLRGPVPTLHAAAAAHIGSLFLVIFLLPSLPGWSGKWRAVLGFSLVGAALFRLAGVDAWLYNAPVRLAIQVGQGASVSAAFWLFFTLTPRSKWVGRYVLAWILGVIGREAVPALAAYTSDDVRSALYVYAMIIFVALSVVSCLAICTGDFTKISERLPERRSEKRDFAILAANTFLVAMLLALLAGWIGPFPTMWAAWGKLTHVVAGALSLALCGWLLRRNFSSGFSFLTGITAAGCLAIVTLSVANQNGRETMLIAPMTVGCQTMFFACMTLAIVRTTRHPYLFALATITSHVALFPAGLMNYWNAKFRDVDFSVTVILCLAVFLVFHMSVRRIDFAALDGQAVDPNADESSDATTQTEMTQRTRIRQMYDTYSFTVREREVAELL